MQISLHTTVLFVIYICGKLCQKSVTVKIVLTSSSRPFTFLVCFYTSNITFVYTIFINFSIPHFQVTVFQFFCSLNNISW